MNMDRFKFRAWCTKRKHFVHVGLMIRSDGNLYQQVDTQDSDRFFDFQEPLLTCFKESMIIMQCTGLKDKNGKLIYEGDVVKDYNYNETYFIKWISEPFECDCCSEGYTGFKVVSEYNLNNGICQSADSKALRVGRQYADNFEVIGNIYENPELIK